MTDIYEGLIGKLRRQGIARTNNFFVRIDTSISNLPFRRSEPNQSSLTLRAINGIFPPSDEGATTRNMFTQRKLRSLSFMCKSASLPKREIKTIDYIAKPGYIDKIASYQVYENALPLSFYCSPDLNERRFFENWANLAIDPITKNPNYYDEYAKNNIVTVFVLPRNFSGTFVDENTVDDKGNPLYYVKFFECYPTVIEGTEVALGESQPMELKVNISYKYFRTISDYNFPKVTGYENYNLDAI